MDSNDLYVLTCTECHNAFPPSQFRGQCMEFRMCAQCKRSNPEIYQYLEKYIYQPQRNHTWRPFQERLDTAAEHCEQLEAELANFKRHFAQQSHGVTSACNWVDPRLLEHDDSQTEPDSPQTQSECD